MSVKHDIIEDIQINQLKWYRHVYRIVENRIPIEPSIERTSDEGEGEDTD